jgi:hypothetical protein
LYDVDGQTVEGTTLSPDVDIIGTSMRAICDGRFMGLDRHFLFHDNKLQLAYICCRSGTC